MHYKKIKPTWRDEGLCCVPQRRGDCVWAPRPLTPHNGRAESGVGDRLVQFDVNEKSRPSKIWRIVDKRTRECIGGLTDHFEDVVAVRGTPAVLVSDNEAEFISEAMTGRTDTRTSLFFMPPGSPRRNVNVEKFDSRLRAGCHSTSGFYSLRYDRVTISDRKYEHNHQRIDSSLDELRHEKSRWRSQDVVGAPKFTDLLLKSPESSLHLNGTTETSAASAICTQLRRATLCTPQLGVNTSRGAITDPRGTAGVDGQASGSLPQLSGILRVAHDRGSFQSVVWLLPQ